MKTSILTLALVASFIFLYEIYWRGRGFTLAYNDDKVLLANRRKEIYHPRDQATNFIGSSRSRFDIDIPTWEKIPVKMPFNWHLEELLQDLFLHNLARDEQLTGKVIIDIAEQFFSVDSIRGERAAQEAIGYYVEETPAQKFSAAINFFLESQLVFLEEGRFGLTALLSELELPSHPGIFVRPSFPKEFSMLTIDQQSKFTPMFLASLELQRKQLEARAKVIANTKVKPVEGKALELFLTEIRKSMRTLLGSFTGIHEHTRILLCRL